MARKGMATAALAVAGILLAGCATSGGARPGGTTPADTGPEASSTTTTGPDMTSDSPAPGDASSLAASLFAPLELSLPASADGSTVDQTPVEPFANASLTSFTADTAEMKSICVSAGSTVAPDAQIVAQDAKVLRRVGIEPGSTLCSKDTDSGRGPAFRVVIPPHDSGKIHVAIYQLPAGR
jgi:hypothetical protein